MNKAKKHYIKTVYEGIDVYQLLSTPEGYNAYGEISELYDHDLKELPRDTRFIIYWYVQGSYDGDGACVVGFADGTLTYKSLSHCSCYGGLDMDFPTTRFKTIEELEKDLTEGMKVELLNVIEAYKELFPRKTSPL